MESTAVYHEDGHQLFICVWFVCFQSIDLQVKTETEADLM